MGQVGKPRLEVASAPWMMTNLAACCGGMRPLHKSTAYSPSARKNSQGVLNSSKTSLTTGTSLSFAMTPIIFVHYIETFTLPCFTLHSLNRIIVKQNGT